MDLVELLDDVHGHADRAALVGDRAGDGLADPPGGVGGELEALAVVELLGGADEPDRALLDQVEEREALVAVALRDRDDEAEVGLDHRLLGGVVAALDALRELDLLRGGEQRHLADVLEEELQRVGRDLGFGLPFLLALRLVASAADDLDLRVLEGRVELVHLCGVEVELVERERDLLGVELAGEPARHRTACAPLGSRTSSTGPARATSTSVALRTAPFHRVRLTVADGRLPSVKELCRNRRVQIPAVASRSR